MRTSQRVLLAICGFALVPALASAKTIEIKMVNAGKEGPMAFEPAFVKAEPGDSIKFIPTDKTHNSSSIFTPPGATPWKGKPDEAITVKLTKEGVYLYQCDPHAVMAMVGVVQVGKASNLVEAKAEAAKRSAAFAMNKDRFTKYLSQAK